MEEKEGKMEIEFTHVAKDLLIQAYIMGAQPCPTLFDSMDWPCQCPMSMEFFRQEKLEWVAISFSNVIKPQ